MSRVYRSPRSRSAAAATAPARLAQEFGSVLWRERPDGELEVAAMRDGRVRRFLVRDDGSATPLESEQPVFGRWRRPLAFSGWGLGVASILAMGALGEDATAWGVAGFFIGMALFAAGGIAAAINDRPNTPRERLKQLGANGHPWLEIRTRVEEPSE
jgi:hypothetical protein